MEKKDDDKCANCGLIETTEHLFYECPRIRAFWESFNHWYQDIFGINVNIRILDVIFGVPNENGDEFLHVLNYSILFAKSLIYSCHKQNTVCLLNTFKSKFEERLDIELYISETNNSLNKFEKRWLQVYVSLNN